MHYFPKDNNPSLEVSKSLTVKLVVSLKAFSGATPINWGNRPTYVHIKKYSIYTVLVDLGVAR